LRGRARNAPAGWSWACDERRKGAQRRAVAISTPLAARARSRIALVQERGTVCVRAQKHFSRQSPERVFLLNNLKL
jgi:hypothetical protein